MGNSARKEVTSLDFGFNEVGDDDEEKLYVNLRGEPNIKGKFIYVIGSYKVGKSYIIKKFAETIINEKLEIISDQVKNTRGEVVYNFGNYYVVDTEGLHQPMSTNRSSIIKTYILEHSCNSASMILFIIDKFLQEDWRLFLDVVNICRSRDNQPIIVFLHNNRYLSNPGKIKEYQDQIISHNQNFSIKDGEVWSDHNNFLVRQLFMGENNGLNSITNKLAMNKIISLAETITPNKVNYWDGAEKILRSTISVYHQRNLIQPLKIENGVVTIPDIFVPKKDKSLLLDPPISVYYTKKDENKERVVRFHFNLPYSEAKSVELLEVSGNKLIIKYQQVINDVSKGRIECLYLNANIVELNLYFERYKQTLKYLDGRSEYIIDVIENKKI